MIDSINLTESYQYKLQLCQRILDDGNSRILIEESQCADSEFFVNNIKFLSKARKQYLVSGEIIDISLCGNIGNLLAAVIVNIVHEMELLDGKADHFKVFRKMKILSSQLSDGCNSFALSTVLSHHLRDLAELAAHLGYENGILIQLGKVDISTERLRVVLNEARDFFQLDGFSWLIVGSVGLTGFISRHIGRLDEIISERIFI